MEMNPKPAKESLLVRIALRQLLPCRIRGSGQATLAGCTRIFDNSLECGEAASGTIALPSGKQS